MSIASSKCVSNPPRVWAGLERLLARTAIVTCAACGATPEPSLECSSDVECALGSTCLGSICTRTNASGRGRDDGSPPPDGADRNDGRELPPSLDAGPTGTDASGIGGDLDAGSRPNAGGSKPDGSNPDPNGGSNGTVVDGCDALPDTSRRIGRAQIGVNRIDDRRVLQGTRDYIWADRGEPVPGVFSSIYMPNDRDFDRSHTIEWYRANRPEWIVYQCDERSPAHYEPAYSWGYYTPVDTTRLDVRQELFRATPGARLMERPYQGVSMDNVTLRNDRGRCGVRDENGRFVRQFSGERWDRAFVNAVTAWIRFMDRYAGNRDLCTSANLKFPFEPHRDDYLRAATSVDVVLDETGFHRSCELVYQDDEWLERVTTLAEVAEQRGLVVIDQVCERWEDITPELVNASIANYMMVKGNRSYLAITAQGQYQEFVDYSQLYEDIGDARSPIVQAGSLYRRFFRNAIVLVNPSSRNSAAYTLNNDSWTYLGRPVAGRITLAPGESRLIMRRR